MKKFSTANILLFFLLFFLAANAPKVYAQRAAFISPAEKFARTSDKRKKRAETLSFIRTELFFGRNKPNGAEVSEAEFDDFLNAEITPKFPDGLTVFDGIGQFRDAQRGKTIQEKAKVLILLYPASARRQNSRKIEGIRAAYKNRFAQQSVLRVDNILLVRVSF